MALVYNKLYQSDNLASIKMTDYINELIAGLIKSYAAGPSRVLVNVVPSEVLLSIDMAVPCGLVINELVTEEGEVKAKNLGSARPFSILQPRLGRKKVSEKLLSPPPPSASA